MTVNNRLKITMEEFILNEISSHKNLFNSRLDVLFFMFSDKSGNFNIIDDFLFEHINGNKIYDHNYFYETLNIYIIPWGKNTENIYSRFLNIKNEGFTEELIYFCKRIEEIQPEDFKIEDFVQGRTLSKETLARQNIKLNEKRKALISWKENLPKFKRAFGTFLIEDKMKNF
jgi:hypothetical protein